MHLCILSFGSLRAPEGSRVAPGATIWTTNGYNAMQCNTVKTLIHQRSSDAENVCCLSDIRGFCAISGD